MKDELYKYICGIVTNKNQKVCAINGVADHIHILLSLKPDVSLSNLVRDIKANSTNWINLNKKVMGKFQQQEGFGAFSYSRWDLDTIINYIDRQEEHHAKTTFKEEYLGLLEKYDIEYNEKYLFEWAGQIGLRMLKSTRILCKK